MKVLILNGSPHAKGTTAGALAEMEKVFKENGVETETILIGSQTVRGCIGCYKCKDLGKCVFDDLVNETAEKQDKADGLVIASPVYYSSANGTMVAFMDRLMFSSKNIDKTMKVAASVAAARRGGTTATFDQLNKYITYGGFAVATSQYWNIVHGANAEDVKKDEEGLQTLRTLARNMVFLMKSIALGKEKFGLPEKEAPLKTNFIR